MAFGMVGGWDKERQQWGDIDQERGSGTFPIYVALNNTGTVKVNSGSLCPSNYSQTATGTLEIGIGGLAEGEFGRLNVCFNFSGHLPMAGASL